MPRMPRSLAGGRAAMEANGATTAAEVMPRFAARKREKPPDLRRAFLGTLTEERVRGLATTMLKAALSGDVRAAKLVLEYALGRPNPAPEVVEKPDGLGVPEFALVVLQ